MIQCSWLGLHKTGLLALYRWRSACYLLVREGYKCAFSIDSRTHEIKDKTQGDVYIPLEFAEEEEQHRTRDILRQLNTWIQEQHKH